VESFFDVFPDTLAWSGTCRRIPPSNVALKADAVKVYGLTFKFTYDTARLTLTRHLRRSLAPVGRCLPWPNPNPAGVVSYICQLYYGDSEWTATAGTIATFGFTAKTLDDDHPCESFFDIYHEEPVTSAGAIGGQKVFVNNAGFNAPSAPDRNIATQTMAASSSSDWPTTRAMWTCRAAPTTRAPCRGARDLQLRLDAAGFGTSASSGSYTTAHVSPYWLAADSTYWLQADRVLYLPTTVLYPTPAATYAHSKLLGTVPLTTLLKVVLLGGDANNNNQIEVGDLSLIGGQYGNTGVVCGSGSCSDVTGDGIVNVQGLVPGWRQSVQEVQSVDTIGGEEQAARRSPCACMVDSEAERRQQAKSSHARNGEIAQASGAKQWTRIS